MSGTSLDGLDIAYCRFKHEEKKWKFSIKKAVTLKYENNWLNKLGAAQDIPGEELIELHNQYGAYLGNAVRKFIKENKIEKVDFVASHGHTIFHQPEKHFTFQLGHGASIAAACGLPVVSDFRALDVALGGQGAPLVPIGDMLLFKDYDYCLNLGGFANISFQQKDKRIAFDICPGNIVLNFLAGFLNMEYDRDGEIASKGKVNAQVLHKLNALAYYKKPFPKSLGREWVEKEFIPMMDNWHSSIEDKIATVTEHTAMQIAVIVKGKKGKLLVTGGGAFNTHLVWRIKHLAPSIKIVVPDKELVNGKEALVFAFLGVLRWRGEANSLKSVTGASKNNSGGSIFLP
jgi:anhydro-N-acetylmuramic acid kinase